MSKRTVNAMSNATHHMTTHYMTTLLLCVTVLVSLTAVERAHRPTAGVRKAIELIEQCARKAVASSSPAITIHLPETRELATFQASILNGLKSVSRS